MSKRVLITGGAGFIGSNTANYFVELGYDVTIIDNLNQKTHNGFFPKHLNEKIVKVLGSVTDEKLMTKLILRCDYILHLAAELDLNPDFKKFIDVNVGSTALIYEIIFKNKINIKKVVVASTQFVYGEGKYLDKSGNIFFPESRLEEDLQNKKWEFYGNSDETLDYQENIESQKVNPTNHYALSKYFQEQLSIRLGKLYKIPTVALRYSIVHGPYQSLKNTYSGALRTFVISCLDNIPFSTFEDNMSKRDFISIDDVVTANRIVMETKKSNYEIYNVGGNESYSVYQLAQIVTKALNKELVFRNDIEYRLGDVRNSISNSEKLKKLGWKNLTSEQETVKKYIEWVKKMSIDFQRFRETQKIIRKNGSVKKVK